MKIPKEQENPIDIYNIKIVDKICPYFKKINMTPNQITTLSLIFGIISIYYMWNYNWIGFGITYYISYIFDCMDGQYARRYNMVTKGGDYYDHIKDVSVIIMFLIVVIKRYELKREIWIKYISCLVTFGIIMISHLGCQEKLYQREKEESPTLCLSKCLCPGDAERNIQYTKWGGCGTWTIIFIILGIYIIKERENK